MIIIEMQSVALLNDIKKSAVMLSLVMLNIPILKITMLSVIMLMYYGLILIILCFFRMSVIA